MIAPPLDLPGEVRQARIDQWRLALLGSFDAIRQRRAMLVTAPAARYFSHESLVQYCAAQNHALSVEPKQIAASYACQKSLRSWCESRLAAHQNEQQKPMFRLSDHLNGLLPQSLDSGCKGMIPERIAFWFGHELAKQVSGLGQA
jgi:hypothetical protein